MEEEREEKEKGGGDEHLSITEDARAATEVAPAELLELNEGVRGGE